MEKTLLLNFILFFILPLSHISLIKLTNIYKLHYLYITFFIALFLIYFISHLNLYFLLYLLLINLIYLISYHFIFMGITYDSPTLKIIELIHFQKSHKEIRSYFSNSNIVESRFQELLSKGYLILEDEEISLTNKSLRIIKIFMFIRKLQKLTETNNG